MKQLLDLQDLVDEQDRINSLPECPEEVEEYFGEVLTGIDNIIDCVCEKIDFSNLPPQ